MTDSEARMFAMSAAYEHFMGRWSRILAPVYVLFAGVGNGDRVLDIGAGTGSLSLAVDAMPGVKEVVGIDPSEGLLAHARKNAKAGRPRFEVGDAQSLKFENASFDKTMTLLVINFVPDHDKAIAEMRRVTRPGGGVSACVWDYNDGMEMLRFFWDEAVTLDPAAEKRDERHMKLTREGHLGDAWKKAGLTNVQEKPLVIEQSYTSFDDYWEPFLKGAGPAGAYVVALPEDRRQQLESRLRKRLLSGKSDGPFVLKARAWAVKGDAP
jgi:SAM-dependent methyltransferase